MATEPTVEIAGRTQSGGAVRRDRARGSASAGRPQGVPADDRASAGGAARRSDQVTGSTEGHSGGRGRAAEPSVLSQLSSTSSLPRELAACHRPNQIAFVAKNWRRLHPERCGVGRLIWTTLGCRRSDRMRRSGKASRTTEHRSRATRSATARRVALLPAAPDWSRDGWADADR